MRDSSLIDVLFRPLMMSGLFLYWEHSVSESARGGDFNREGQRSYPLMHCKPNLRSGQPMNLPTQRTKKAGISAGLLHGRLPRQAAAGRNE
jgi:hypothetical protein